MDNTRKLLEQFKNGEISTEDALQRLMYEDTGYAKIDHGRKSRTGYPEVIFGQGKTAEQAAEIFQKLAAKGSALCTRADEAMAQAILNKTADAVYYPAARILSFGTPPEQKGLVVIATGGTSDIPVAEEAAVVLEHFGSRVKRLYDVGVAGVHRLLANADMFENANCVIAVAGMEGALASVVAGLVHVPVIAVPTSVGYGASFGGLAALLSMLNSCASGVSVVNIDNGYGAACQADMINKLAISSAEE